MIGLESDKESYSKKQRVWKDKHWWEPIAKALVGVTPEGLKVKCPKCGEIGLVITRWIKGATLKPLYILHTECGEVKKVCELNEEQSGSIRGKIPVLEGDIERLIESRKSFVLFSGGKDSLAALVYLRDVAKNVHRDLTAIYVDTTAGLPENAKYVREVCNYLGVNLEVVSPTIDYFTLVKKWGIPSFRYRWCCRELKIKPIQEYLNSVREPKVVFDGIRAAESYIRKQYIPIWYHPSFRCLSVSPIFHWADHQVISFINSNGIPKNLLHSLLGTSTECWCGAYKTKADFEKLFNIDREMFYKLVEVEKENKSGYTFIYENGCRTPLTEVAKELKKANKND